MPLDKLAGFMDMAPEDFRNYLLAFKHKMQNVVWTKGTSGLDGEFQSGSEVDFYIDKNMIHIADTKVKRFFSSSMVSVSFFAILAYLQIFLYSGRGFCLQCTYFAREIRSYLRGCVGRLVCDKPVCYNF